MEKSENEIIMQLHDEILSDWLEDPVAVSEYYTYKSKTALEGNVNKIRIVR